MTIREVSEKFGISPDTLRYYEKVGMIPPVTRVSGIRSYSEEDLVWVRLAICMRASGMPVEAMVQYVDLFRKGDETIPERLALLLEQKKELIHKREKIDNALVWIEKKIERYRDAEKTGVLEWSDK